MRKIIYFTSFILVTLVISCKKDTKTTTNNVSNTGAGKTGSTLDLVKDSIYLYAKEDYLWHDALPDYTSFNPRSFTGSTDIDALTKEVDAISQYKVNPATGKPYEFYANAPGQAKYSFIDDGTASSRLNGIKGDYGFGVLYNAANDLRVKYVYPGSPADKAGVKRGYQITVINGRSGSSLDYDNSNGPNVSFVLNALSSASTINLTLQKPDGSSFSVSLNAASYTINPVLTYKIFDQGNGRKVGYIVFNSFTSDANATPQLTTAFNSFASNGVTDLVVDLRYNGGGYVSTAEFIDNLIVPSSKSGTLMYNTYYNDNLTSGKAPLLKNQVRKDPSTGQSYNLGQIDYSVAGSAVKFAKKGSLNVNHVFFIVTGSTASASELTINNLRPVMDVQLIGQTTYGKPVGFFDIDINKYQLYIPEFSTKNATGQGDYYSGMNPGSSDYPGVNDYDDVTKDFGDPTESLLAHALNYVKFGSFTLRGPQVQSLSSKTFSIQEANDISIKMNQNEFKGMVYDKAPRKH